MVSLQFQPLQYGDVLKGRNTFPGAYSILVLAILIFGRIDNR
jgi:hypothetical protein